MKTAAYFLVAIALAGALIDAWLVVGDKRRCGFANTTHEPMEGE